MKDERDKSQATPPARRPYVPPAIETEELFKRVALLCLQVPSACAEPSSS